MTFPIDAFDPEANEKDGQFNRITDDTAATVPLKRDFRQALRVLPDDLIEHYALRPAIDMRDGSVSQPWGEILPTGLRIIP